MRLEVYVTEVQLGDYGDILSVGKKIGFELVGNPGSTVDTAVWPLDTHLSDSGEKVLRKTGLAEYAFCGEIRLVKKIDPYGESGRIYREILIDCGVPILYVTSGIPGMSPEDIDRPGDKNKDTHSSRTLFTRADDAPRAVLSGSRSRRNGSPRKDLIDRDYRI